MWSVPMVAVPTKAHARGAEQLPVAAGAGAHEQRIGVEHMLLPDGAARQTADLRIGLQYAFEVGYGAVGYDFHVTGCLRWQR